MMLSLNLQKPQLSSEKKKITKFFSKLFLKSKQQSTLNHQKELGCGFTMKKTILMHICSDSKLKTNQKEFHSLKQFLTKLLKYFMSLEEKNLKRLLKKTDLGWLGLMLKKKTWMMLM